MELLTPQIIWKGYDASILPLGVSVLSDRKEDGCRVLTAYFNGPTTIGGVVRVFARCVLPLSRKALPAVVLMGDAHMSVTTADVSFYTERGYAVVLPDYAGERDDEPQYTIYPRSMAYANFTPDCLSRQPVDLRRNCWILWAEIAMRAVTFAASLDEVDGDRIAVVGSGVSVASVIKTAAVDTRIRCAVSVFSSGQSPEEEDKTGALNYETALSDGVYAPMIKSPLLMMIASNEQDGSADRMSDAFALIPAASGSRLSISERASHMIGVKQRENVERWLEYHLAGKGTIPDTPALSAECKDHVLYYNVKAPDGCNDVELYVSQAIRQGALRHWSKVKLQRAEGENSFTARVDIYDVRQPVYAFVNACRTGGGMSVSSPILTRLPGLLGVSPTPVRTTRMLYGSEMGTDDWIVLSPLATRRSLTMRKGPFGIRGVSSDIGTLTTFKFSAAHCRGQRNSLLQIMIYSFAEQDATFSVTAYEGAEEKSERYAEYAYTAHLNPADNWTKLTLQASDFKSPFAGCDDWSAVVNMRVDSEAPVAIASMIWI